MFESLSAYCENPNVKFKDQEAGEVVLLLLRRHFVTNSGWLLASLALVLLPPIVLIGNPLPTFLSLSFLPANYLIFSLLIWYLFVLGFVLHRFLDWFFNVTLVTNRRLVDVDYFNLLYFKVAETSYHKFQDVTYNVAGFLGTFFNFGNLFIQTAGTDPNFELSSIPHPAGVHDLITDLMNQGKVGP